MDSGYSAPFRTRDGYLRLRFAETHAWRGEIHVTAGDPADPLVVSVFSDPRLGPPPDVRVEESSDGVNWTSYRGREVRMTATMDSRVPARRPGRRSRNRTRRR